MDEPEAALSPLRQLEALVRITELVQQGAQFILATHSPMLMAIPGATIYKVDELGMHQADYDEIDHVMIYKRLILDREGYVKSLIEQS